MPEKTTVVVLGAGYAGLFAARRAAQSLPATHRESTRVVLVDREPAWIERTRWHQVAAGERVAERPLDALFRGTGVEVLTATVTGIDLEVRSLMLDPQVESTAGSTLGFDRLVYALGSRSTADATPGVLDHGDTLDTPQASRRVATALSERPNMRVTVVGGGLTGIQTATQIADLHPSSDVVLVGSGTLASELPTTARDYVRDALRRRGVEVTEGRVTSVHDGGYVVDDHEFGADVVVWTAGFAPPEMAAVAGLEVTEQGQVVVDSGLRSTSHPFVLAAGDGAAFARAASPFGAYAATATGAVAGRNAVLDTLGQEPEDLNLGYAFLGVSLGRHDAAVQLLKPDGSPRERMITGRVAHAMKEGVEHYVSGALRAERRMPGLYRWSPAGH